ncbi:MAG: hypothetical protein K2M37_01780 [Muribaculaceae bacterium]|nr:hypothetical protein [Muribaculaceae bacterium]
MQTFMAVQKQLIIAAERLPGLNKKLVEAHTLAERDDEDGFAKGCALIRATLHVDIDKIETEEEWAQLYCQALWLERWRNRNRAEMFAGLFGEGKS